MGRFSTFDRRAGEGLSNLSAPLVDCPERTALVVDPVRVLRAPLPTLLGVQTAGMSESRIPASEALWNGVHAGASGGCPPKPTA